MDNPPTLPPQRKNTNRRKTRNRRLKRLVEFKGVRDFSLPQYRNHVRKLYDGPAGAVLNLASTISMHEPLVGHMLRSKKFDVSGYKSILDIGAGAGQILGHLVKSAHPDAELVGFDLSHQMLRRARNRIDNSRPHFVTGDLSHMPFADGSFDCVTMGWVLEHLPDPGPGLAEVERVLRPGGSAFILATEDTIFGAMNSRTWKCRTYNRHELQKACEKAGLPWRQQFWFTRLHRLLKMGGILVDAQKPHVSDETSAAKTNGTSHVVNNGHQNGHSA